MTEACTAETTAADIWRSASQYLKRFSSSTAKQKSRLLKKAPLKDLQEVALHHRDASVRRACLFFLDHYANEASTDVFADALQDPVDNVRNAALHSIACESCRTTELPVTDVVPPIAEVLATDPSPDLRVRAIPTLLRLAGRDRTAWEAIERAAKQDPHEIVRRAAAEALQGPYFAPPKRYDRHQRRHAKVATRTRSSTKLRFPDQPSSNRGRRSSDGVADQCPGGA
jgi:HEAT repeat protein